MNCTKESGDQAKETPYSSHTHDQIMMIRLVRTRVGFGFELTGLSSRANGFGYNHNGLWAQEIDTNDVG